MSLGNTTREEAALANVVVEVFQTPISGERKTKRGRWVKKVKRERHKEKERAKMGGVNVNKRQ